MNFKCLFVLLRAFFAMRFYAFAGGVDSIRLVLPPNPRPLVLKAAELVTRHVGEPCETKVVTSGNASLKIDLGFKPGLGLEGFRALLDNELKRNDGRSSERVEEAFRELTGVYHAAHADTPVRPPWQ